MPEAPEECDWTVRFIDGETDTVRASYWLIREESGWLEFKSRDHKCLFAIHERNVFSVTRN